MTSFVDDNGNYLDYSGADIGLTKQVASWYNFKIKGDISVDFILPNTAKNRDTLNYYGPQQNGRDMYQQFTMVRDGNNISRGYIIVKESNQDQIKCFFVSGNTNWFPRFDFNLKDVDYPDSYTVLSNDIDGRKAATEGIIFPLVDWFASNAKSSISYLRMGWSTNPEEFPVFSEVHPCIYLHTMVSQMAVYAGVKIEGDLMNDPLYKSIILTNDGPEYYVPDSTIERSYVKLQNGPFSSAGGGLYDYTLDPQLVRFQTILDGAGQLDTSTYALTVPYTGTYEVIFDLWVSVGDTYSIDYYVDGASYVGFTGAVTTQNKIVKKILNLRKGQKLQFYVNNTASANYRLDYLTGGKYTNVIVRLAKKVTGVPFDGTAGTTRVPYVPFSAIAPDMKATDLIKFLSVYFSGVITYDEYAKKIEINRLDYIQKEDAEDWSEYFSGQYTVKFDQNKARLNFIQSQEGPEAEIVSYNAQSLVTYGGGTIETGSEAVETGVYSQIDSGTLDPVETKEVYRIPFGGSWDDVNKTAHNIFLPYIKFYDLELVETVSYAAVANNGGRAQVTATFNDPISDTDVFYVDSQIEDYTGWASCLGGATSTTNPILMLDYVSSDTGTIYKYKCSRVTSIPRMLICRPGTTLSDIGGGADLETWLSSSLTVSTITTAPVCWFDKANCNLPIDVQKDSLAVDSIRGNIGNKYLSTVRKIFKNPLVEMTFNIPLKVIADFNFQKFVYLKTRDVTGYFFVEKIDNYKDPVTPVKVTLLYVD